MKNKSFTLIEILVATFIFTVTVTIIFSTFYFTSSYQAKNATINETTQQAQYAMDTIVNDIRWAKNNVNIDTPCDVFVGAPICLAIGSLGEPTVKRYWFDQSTGQIKNFSTPLTLSDSVYVENFSFSKSSSLITISMTFRQKSGLNKEVEKSVITLQTSVIPRRYDK